VSPRSPKGELISDRYRIEDRLGSGGMSSVFRAQDTILERTVAVKILAEHLSDDEPASRRAKVRQWITLHRAELQAAWSSASAGRPLDSIDPLP
jgi:serine/threonine protein kinase